MRNHNQLEIFDDVNIIDGGMGEGRPILVEWDIYTEDTETGDINFTHGKNLVVNTGRTQLLSLAFVPSASSIGGFYFLGVGASSTTAQVTDTRLTYELIGNTTRKSLLDTNGNVPNSGDIQLQTITIGGCTFYEYIVLQATYATNDGNNNNTFSEYGLFTTGTLPGSPTSTSGIMFNHYIDPNPAIKTATNTVQAVVTIRM